jgi:DNA-binding MarR family transcriptional regulator
VIQSPLQSAEQMVQASRRLVRALQLRDRACCADHGLSSAQWHALRALFEEGSTTMHGLADRVHVTRSTLTRSVDLLEKKGLVKRRASQSDRRQVQVGLTRKGEELSIDVHAGILQASREILQQLRPPQRDSALAGFVALAAAAGRWADRTLPSDALRSLALEAENIDWLDE